MRKTIWLGSIAAISAIWAQGTTGKITGRITDPNGLAVEGASVTAVHLETNSVHSAISREGLFRLPQMEIGTYRITIRKEGFAAHIREPISVEANQTVDVPVALELPVSGSEITVRADASLLNTANSELGVRFQPFRISELPLSPDRNVLGLALSVPGVSQLSSNQVDLAAGGVPGTGAAVTFSINGMRTRSNNFMIDGQDSNDPTSTGLVQSLNNPDIVAEFQLVTGQFPAEFGRAAGSVVNVITKSGTNQWHGSAFVFHNDNHLNSRSNLDKRLFSSAPFRVENQIGGTAGGPIVKDRTFWFASLERWTDRKENSGVAIRGVPTEEGRTILRGLFANRPSVRLLLANLPAAQTPAPGLSSHVTSGAAAADVPLGILSGADHVAVDDWQWSGRVDHHIGSKHVIGTRYLFDDSLTSGAGQANPPGLYAVVPSRRQAATAFWDVALSSAIYNEFRAGFQRGSTFTRQADGAPDIPSIEVVELGLTGFNPSRTRTAIGLPITYPFSHVNNQYQLQDSLGVVRGRHAMKFGGDVRRQDIANLVYFTQRGRLQYLTLQNLADDVAQSGSISTLAAGAEPVQHYRFYEYFLYAQDEWRVRPNFSLSYGLRYESPGNPTESLAPVAARVLALAGGNPKFRFGPIPPRDTNNWAPRFGFSWALLPATVLRGGYARTYDFQFLEMLQNLGYTFPFVNSVSIAPGTRDALQVIQNYRAGVTPIAAPAKPQGNFPAGDFRSPYAEQFSLELERELHRDWIWKLGWVATKGTALFQTIDANPTIPGTRAQQRVDPNYAQMRVRCNCTSSIYHSLQTSVEKRLSRGLALTAHYTWSSFIDGASDVFNPSSTGEVAVAQDSFNRRADRGPSSYDRRHRFVANGVYEIPFRHRWLGGWQVSGFLTLQSGAPFTVLNGADPGFRLTGIDVLVGNAIRPNLATNLDLSRMTVDEILRAGGARLFSPVTAEQPIGNLGRNTLRAAGIRDVDLAVAKNTRIGERYNVQFRAEFYDLTNTRNFGIPESRVNSENFLNQWGQDGGNRRITGALRFIF